MFRRIQRLVEQLVFFAAITFCLTGDAPPPGTFETRLDRIVGADRFGFILWEADALAEKGAGTSIPLQDYLDDRQRAQFVVDYLDRTRQLFTVERDIDRMYADPGVGNPDAASADLRARRDRLRAEVEQRRPTAEAIFQDQIAAVLADEGLAVGGRTFPPVLARITPLPHILILSPRDQIKREPGLDLSADLPIERIEAIENQVAAQFDKSAYVTPIGGLALYPSMIDETPDLLWLLQVMSHEWTHNWLFLRPLGVTMLFTSIQGGDILTINETTASIVGDEVGIKVLKRFYPEIAKRDYAYVYEPPKPADAQNAPPPKPDPNAFDFGHEMHVTRVQVDEYLAEAHSLNVKADEAGGNGRTDEAKSLRAQALEWIVKAENYMEDRRKVFVEHGYPLRKLNQAYFAFHGSYADQPGASGADPVGPTVVDLRHKSPSLVEFLNRVSAVTSFDDLKRVVAQYP